MTPEEIKALQDAKAASDAEVARLKAEIEKGKTPPKEGGTPPPADDKSLKEKADKERQEREKAANDGKRVESAIAFNMGLAAFMESSKDLLPSTVAGIIEAASKENYDSQAQKANAVRGAMIQEFFTQAENVELLTASQKAQLTEFLGLTKNVREERSESYYNNLFEPVVETKRKVRKAEELTKAAAGIGDSGGVEEAYRQRLIKKSRRVYLGEKESA